MDIYNNWQNPHVDALAEEVKATVGRTKWKPPELPFPTKLVNQGQYSVMQDLERFILPPKISKMMGISILSQINSPIGFMQLIYTIFSFLLAISPYLQ